MSLNHKVTVQWAATRKLNLNAPIPENASGTPPAVEPPAPVAGRKRRPTPSREQTPQKKAKTADPSKSYPPPSTRLADLGGVQPCVEKLLELVAMPLRHPEIYLHTGVHPPRGVLLHGPPGCGKTLLANAIAGVSPYGSRPAWSRLMRSRNCRCLLLASPPLRSCPGCQENPKRHCERPLRKPKFALFLSLLPLAQITPLQKHAPCLLFIDEIDAITPKRESAQREMERRIVAQFLTCMDGRPSPPIQQPPLSS